MKARSVQAAAFVALLLAVVATLYVSPSDALTLLSRDVPPAAGWGLLAAALVLGIVAILVARTVFLVASLAALLAVAALSPAERIDIPVLAFGGAFFLYLELGSAVPRFARYEATLAKGGTASDLPRLAGRYLASLPVPIVLVAGLSALGLLLFRLLSPLLPDLFAESLEVQGVYGAVFGTMIVLGAAYAVVRFVRRN
ncbi:MAG: hypothetical protein ACT4PT_04880 [Methanobacteriota archaeon]